MLENEIAGSLTDGNELQRYFKQHSKRYRAISILLHVVNNLCTYIARICVNLRWKFICTVAQIIARVYAPTFSVL